MSYFNDCIYKTTTYGLSLLKTKHFFKNVLTFFFMWIILLNLQLKKFFFVSYILNKCYNFAVDGKLETYCLIFPM